MGRNKKRSIGPNRQGSKKQNSSFQQATTTHEEVSGNAFQDALRRKDYGAAKKILDSNTNMEAWRKLNLEGLITISQGDLIATERILLRAIRYPECGVKPYKNLVSVYSQMGRLRDALPLAEKAYKMDPENLEVGLLFINCLLDLARADDVIKTANKLLEKNKNHRQLMLAKASALRAAFRPEESSKLSDEILELYPNDPTAMRMKADILGDKDSTAAVKIYDQAAAIVLKTKGKPDIAMMWNSSLHLLRTRDFKRGWDCWELGFAKEVGTMGRNLIPQVKVLPRADKNKDFDPEKWTLVVVEQELVTKSFF